MKYYKYDDFYLVQYDDYVGYCYGKYIPCKVLKRLQSKEKYTSDVTGKVIEFHEDTLIPINQEDAMLELL